MAQPWMTTDDLLESVKRRISFPASQATFADADIIAFMNEEMFISQVPSVLLYHQEYFVAYKDVTLNPNQTKYPIPNRAIGLRLRDLFFLDNNKNLYEMTRINPEEKAWWQRDFNAAQQPYPYFLENNDITLAGTNMPNPFGSFRISYFLRPNQLVANSNAAIIQSFNQSITPNTPANLDTLLITIPPANNQTSQNYTLTAISSGTPTQYQYLIGITNTQTAINLSNLINSLSIGLTAIPTGSNVNVSYPYVNTTFQASNIATMIIPNQTIIQFDQVPTNILASTEIDFLQTKPGHKILNYDVLPVTVSGTSVVFNNQDLPDELLVGDYICLANTAIIPYLPPDLHTVLAERTAARILSAIGDLDNLQAVNLKIQEMEKAQGSLIDNRIDGKPQKVSNKHTLLHYGKRFVRRF
jgi:hypothetical protein